MILRDLLSDTVPAQIQGSLEREILHVAYDSRAVQMGTVFFALPGTKTEGVRFVENALQRGACAIVVPAGSGIAAETLPPHLAAAATIITVSTPRILLGLVADRFYDQPSTRLTLVGVTGTSGKTTTTYLIEAIWQAMGWSTGVIGTVNYRYQGRELPAPFTTPEAIELQELLSAMVKAGVTHAVMEVSSHALVQERVRGCRWDGALFTNLGRDHLDFHQDLDDYFAAKSRLFLQALVDSEKANRFAAINADDPWGAKLLAQPLPGRVLTYGLDSSALVSVRQVEKDWQGLRGVLRIEDREVRFVSPLIGEPHLYNILAATTAAHAVGVPPDVIAGGLAYCTTVPGRMEAVRVGQPFAVLVDYAHKPDALEKVLRSVRQMTSGRVLTVFGCGGDRDRGKRPVMGEVTGRLSHVAILTSDNPRTEDPWQIIAEAETGLIQAGVNQVSEIEAIATLSHGYVVIADRRTAIRAALAGAQPGDVVLIAGKGHEDYQIIGTTKSHFDDREEVRDYLRQQYGEGRV